MQSVLLGGVAAFDAGRYAAARDVWASIEPDEAADARLLDGLSAFADVAVRGRNSAFDGLADRAAGVAETLAELDDHRGVDVDGVRETLAAVAADPEVLERRRPERVTVDGAPVALADLGLDAALSLAVPLADDLGYDPSPVARAVDYARADRDSGEPGSQFVAFVWDFVGDAEARPVAYRRLCERGDRREARERDVEGLFD